MPTFMLTMPKPCLEPLRNKFRYTGAKFKINVFRMKNICKKSLT